MVPRSQVRILAPQPSLAPVTDTKLAAVVMAGGLGTRMRSAVPEAPAPAARPPDGRLGARGRPAARRRPARRRRLAGDARRVRRTSRSPSRSARSAPATPSAAPARRSRRRRRGARPLRRHAAADVRPARASSSRRTAARRPPATVLSFEPGEPRSYGRIVRDDGRQRPRDRRGARRDARAARASREVNSSIYVFRADALWPALERLEPHNAQGELYLTDAVATSSTAASASRPHVAPDPARREGVNTRVELAAAARRAARPDQRSRTCSPASRSSIPPTTWIEPTSTLEPDAVVHPFTVLRGRTTVAARRRDRAARGRRRRRDRPGRDRRAVLLPSPRNGARAGAEGGHVRGDQELADRRRHEGAASLLHRRRRDRRGHEHRRRHRSPRTSRTSRAGRRARRRSASNVRIGVDTMFVAPVDGRRRRLDGGRHGRHGRRPGQTRSSVSRRARTIKEGYAVESGTIEQSLPGPRGARRRGPSSERRPRDRR